VSETARSAAWPTDRSRRWCSSTRSNDSDAYSEFRGCGPLRPRGGRRDRGRRRPHRSLHRHQHRQGRQIAAPRHWCGSAVGDGVLGLDLSSVSPGGSVGPIPFATDPLRPLCPLSRRAAVGGGGWSTRPAAAGSSRPRVATWAPARRREHAQACPSSSSSSGPGPIDSRHPTTQSPQAVVSRIEHWSQSISTSDPPRPVAGRCTGTSYLSATYDTGVTGFAPVTDTAVPSSPEQPGPGSTGSDGRLRGVSRRFALARTTARRRHVRPARVHVLRPGHARRPRRQLAVGPLDRRGTPRLPARRRVPRPGPDESPGSPRRDHYVPTCVPAWEGGARRSGGGSGRGRDRRQPTRRPGGAHRAGLAWWGKNTMLLTPGLGTVVPDRMCGHRRRLPAGRTMTRDCGTCDACLPACPTGALVEPGVLDARRCLAAILQAPGEIPVEYLRPHVGDRLYGCDDCIEACPPGHGLLQRRSPTGGATSTRWRSSRSGNRELLDRFGTSTSGRNVRILRRNALVVLGNVGDESHMPLLAGYLAHPDRCCASTPGGRSNDRGDLAGRLAADHRRRARLAEALAPSGGRRGPSSRRPSDGWRTRPGTTRSTPSSAPPIPPGCRRRCGRSTAGRSRRRGSRRRSRRRGGRLRPSRRWRPGIRTQPFLPL
jgi:ferredoxin